MKKYLFLLITAFLINQVSSQCTYSVYPQYIKITAAQTITAQNTYYWVCENVVLTVDSSLAGTFFLEQNSKIIFAKASTSCDAVYAKSSCTVINTSPGCVAITANPSNVLVQNTGSGTAVIGFTCPVVNYIYSGVTGPCLSTGINNISLNENNLQIYPNPVAKTLQIKGSENKTIDKVIIIDLLGRIVLEQKENTDQINVQDLDKGIYQIMITSEGKKYSNKFIKE